MKSERGENVADTCICPKERVQRGSLNSWEAQIYTPVKEARRRPRSCMGRLESKPVCEAECLKGLPRSEKGTVYPPVQKLCLVFGRRKGVFLENSSAWPGCLIGL